MVLLFLISFTSLAGYSQSHPRQFSGIVVDPDNRPVPSAHLEIVSAQQEVSLDTDASGAFDRTVSSADEVTIRVEAPGFQVITQRFGIGTNTAGMMLRLERLATVAQQVIVTDDVSKIALDSPDPGLKVMVREELLDANPGRPGAPVSIPGMPIETASGGIKAPQYFVPGVAGDHGEPIAQYIGVGDYLASNNLSANAHGNGYADPNVYISAVLGSVITDGGAFNVLEGNHALNLAATYSLRTQVRRFITLTGDYRDIDLAAGFAPSDPATKEWIAIEANFGNGLMRTLEHRQQYKWNAMRVFDPRNHEITLLSIGYYGHSHEGNLVPVGNAVQLNDTIDPRQQDQTHTGILAVNDIWKIGENDALSSSGYFRTYNLALFSNFGEGLIRQSEFRTVEDAEVRESHRFTPWLEGMAGLDYNEDDIHRDNLDHYLSGNSLIFGPFVKVLANNITISEVAPIVAFHGDLGTHLHFYAGLRHEQIGMSNTDMLKPEESFDAWRGFENPKATATWTPGTGSAGWLPSASFSIGQAFFTQDPRISAAEGSKSGEAALASPFERSHSEQLMLEKDIKQTNFRITLGRTTTTATLAKIDPDNGLAEDEGPGILKYLTASVRQHFSFGMAQAVFSKADARDDDTGVPTPEAPRTIFDFLTTLDRLPWGLHVRSEYEYVGHKFLDVGNPNHTAQYEAIPVGETRLAVVRTFMEGRLQLGTDGMIARGYTGQTTETFAPAWKVGGPPPTCVSGVDGIANDFDCGTIEQAVGIRTVSWIGAAVSWRFGSAR